MAELTDIRNSLKTVLNHLKMSETELNRPNEDVVTLSVCLGARQSLSTLMRIKRLFKIHNLLPVEDVVQSLMVAIFNSLILI